MKMTPEEFVDLVLEHVVTVNCKASNDIHDTKTIEDCTDEHWKKVITLYSSLEVESRFTIKDIVREESIAAISGLFALLDGVFLTASHPKQFTLSYEDGPPLNGDLLDIIVEKVYG